GYTLEFADCLLFFLPGVPHEMRRMFEESVIPIVCAGRYGLGRRERRIVRLFGIPESEVDARLSPIIARFSSVDFHFVADAPEVAIKLTPRGETKGEGEGAVIAAADAVAETLAEFVFARNRKPVEQLILEALQRRGAWLSTAESVTGGRIGDLLTNVAGSSHLFAGGIVAYTARAKHELLGVPEGVLLETGTVSEETTTAMAQGVRARLDTDFGLAVTGFAGPEGGGSEKPVGTTFIAVATSEETTCTHHRFEGSRERIKEVAARTALHLLRRRIEQTPLPVEEV
ncbi:MAG: nicotinamide-nucleotide amidohydrolase family protein, partial [Deltaproteobacteria bacterium]